MFVINEGQLAASAIEIVPKLWGKEYVLVNNEKYCCKILKINPGFRSSIHCHRKKDETFIGISGTALLSMYHDNGKLRIAYGIDSGRWQRIFPKELHSFEAQNLAWIMEISTTHRDDDVVRLEESKAL